MIEAMEQQLINAINFKFKKNKELRIDIDIEHVSNCFRIIGSSRNSTLAIIEDIKINGITEFRLSKLSSNLNWIYSWITKETIESLYIKYTLPLKNKKLEQANLKELENIKVELPEIQSTIVNATIEKLLLFHGIKKGVTMFINPKREWKKFTSLDEKISVLKEFEIISPKATEIKKLYYKGTYSNYNAVECDVVGYVDDYEIILNINGELHSILPDYFVEMQKRERFIIVDIETPMSFAHSSGFREVAAIFVEDYRITDSLHLRIIEDEALSAQGYGKGLAAIEENEILKDQFKAFIKKYKCPLIAHNASFDRGFLKYWGWVDDKTKFYCSMNNIKTRYNFDNYKLNSLLKEFNINSKQTHTAMQDCLDLLEILSITKIDKWTLLGESSVNERTSDNSTNKPRPTYFVSKAKKDNDKKILELAKENIISNILDNKKIVITGDTKMDRVELMALAIKHGGSSPSSVSKKTDFLLVGDNPGKSKLAKAEELNIKIINEDEFIELINAI